MRAGSAITQEETMRARSAITQVETMRVRSAITQEEPIRNRADNHRDRKCRETEETRDRDFKIRHKPRIITASVLN